MALGIASIPQDVAAHLKEAYPNLGLSPPLPADFAPKLQVLTANVSTLRWQTAAVGLGSLAILIAMRKLLPRIPGAIVAVVLASAAVAAFGWSGSGQTGPLVQTIGT